MTCLATFSIMEPLEAPDYKDMVKSINIYRPEGTPRLTKNDACHLLEADSIILT